MAFTLPHDHRVGTIDNASMGLVLLKKLGNRRDRGRRLADGYLHVVYVDDDPASLSEFEQRHKNKLRVSKLTDISEVAGFLARHRDNLPDAVILDLYHPLSADPAERERHRAEVDASLRNVREALDALGKCVDRGLVPEALDTLEDLRGKYSSRQLPVLIRTRQGLNLLQSEQLKKVEELDADWLQKDRRISDSAERARIRRLVRRSRRARHIERDVLLGTALTVLGVLMGHFWT
jgi:hypothetical protein